MRHPVSTILALLALTATLSLAACNTFEGISSEDVAGTPTVYAKVIHEPNPLLLGHWRRSAPAQFSKPWAFDYCLVKKGDRYAVFYFYDSHMKNAFKGWADFTIDGDSMTSGVDGTTFAVEDGKVIMQYPGRTDKYHMVQGE
jgi:predicted small secreted protein